jgi:hypothetical protein
VAFDVNDVGRVALGGSMGPEIAQIEGTLIQQSNGEYLLGVNSISLLRGGVQVWKGEQVHIKPEYVSTIYERRLDKPKTLLLAAGGAALITAIATQGIFGSGNIPPEQMHPDTNVTRRSPPPLHIPILSFALPRIPFLGRP